MLQAHLQAHCQSPTSLPTSQSFVKELAKGEDESLNFSDSRRHKKISFTP